MHITFSHFDRTKFIFPDLNINFHRIQNLRSNSWFVTGVSEPIGPCKTRRTDLYTYYYTITIIINTCLYWNRFKMIQLHSFIVHMLLFTDGRGQIKVFIGILLLLLPSHISWDEGYFYLWIIILTHIKQHLFIDETIMSVLYHIKLRSSTIVRCVLYW